MIEEGAHARLRLEESREILKRKMGTSSKIEKPAEMKLRKEREEYRVRLNDTDNVVFIHFLYSLY